MLNIISTPKARAMLPKFLDAIRDKNSSFVIGRRDKPEAILIKFPTEYVGSLSDITSINSYTSSFDFLKDEKELYSKKDIL